MSIDNFNRTAANLGANWTNQVAGLDTDGSCAREATESDFSTAWWNATTFPPDQYSQIKIGDVTDAVFAGVRMSPTGQRNGLFLSVSKVDNAIELIQWVNSAATTIGTFASAPPFVIGDVYRLEVRGIRYTAYRNGTPYAAKFDVTTFLSGQPGIGAILGKIDEWEGNAVATYWVPPSTPYQGAQPTAVVASGYVPPGF